MTQRNNYRQLDKAILAVIGDKVEPTSFREIYADKFCMAAATELLHISYMLKHGRDPAYRMIDRRLQSLRGRGCIYWADAGWQLVSREPDVIPPHIKAMAEQTNLSPTTVATVLNSYSRFLQQNLIELCKPVEIPGVCRLTPSEGLFGLSIHAAVIKEP